MRLWKRALMMTLLLLLPGCGGSGGDGESRTAELRDRYHDCGGCMMEAAVSCDQEGLAWEAEPNCATGRNHPRGAGGHQRHGLAAGV